MKPLLCTPEVALNIREGRQTQDRRPIPWNITYNMDEPRGPEDVAAGYPFIENEYGEGVSVVRLHPHEVGDILYVREAWRVLGFGFMGETFYATIEYKSDKENLTMELDREKWHPILCRYYARHKGRKFSPNQHMYKEFARTFVTVKRVWVERIQDISSDDCFREGAPDSCIAFNENYKISQNEWFKNLWNSLYGPDAWERNDWVWASKFEINKDLTK